MPAPRRRLRFLLAGIAIAAGAFACTTEFVKNAHCNTKDDCGDPAFPVCDTGRHACAAAGTVFDMAPDLTPMACTQSSMCTGTTEPICDTMTGVCRGCSGADAGVSAECTARGADRPLCSPTGACVECFTNRDCIGPPGKTCDTVAGSCVPCSKNSDCASGICGAGGVCADPTTLVYVNKTGVSCGTGAGSGTLDDPFCTVQAGMNKGAQTGFKVVVFAGTYPENLAVTTTTASYMANLIGIGTPVIAPTATGPALKLVNMGNQIAVSFDGFSFQNATGASGIDCAGNASGATADTRVSIVRSSIHDNAQYGVVTASKCMLSLDQTTVASNLTGGLSLAASDAVIQNCLVVHNGMAPTGMTYGGIYMGNTSLTTTIINTTVVGNVLGGGAVALSGITCAGTANILNTVIHGNSPGTEINAMACPPDHSAFAGAAVAGTGTNNVDLTTCSDGTIFLDAANGNYRPRAGAGVCSLIDTGAGSHVFGATTVTAPNVDITGAMRAQGNGFDIGAYEVM